MLITAIKIVQKKLNEFPSSFSVESLSLCLAAVIILLQRGFITLVTVLLDV